MARIQTACAIRRAHGRVGDIVIKTYKYGEVLSRRPRMENVVRSPKQLAQLERWRQAAAYYRQVKADPVLTMLYARAVAKTGHPLNTVTNRDWFHPPRVTDINTKHYAGGANQLIEVDATDDFHVKAVEVTLRDAAGNIFDYGPAIAPTEGGDWQYRTTRGPSIDGPVTIEAVAIDLPGNRATLTRIWERKPAVARGPASAPAPAIAPAASPAPIWDANVEGGL